jgi:hypothetical protein
MFSWLISIWFKHSGWRFIGTLPKRLNKSIVVAGPHTSKRDFLLAVAVNRLAVLNAFILVDKNNFKGFRRATLRSCRGLKYDPGNDAETMQMLKELYKSQHRMTVAVSAQRRLVADSEWQEFFYDLAKEEEIPIVMVALDYKRKTVKFHTHFHPSIDKQRDLQFMRNFFSYYQGRNHELDIKRSKIANH